MFEGTDNPSPKRLVFEKRKNGAWVDSITWPYHKFTFLQAFQHIISELHAWPALIVGCHLDESTPIAEFFVVEDGVHAEYRLREVQGDE